MVTQKCVNCGASLNIASGERYIECEYCGAWVGNFTPFEKLELVLEQSRDPGSDLVKSLVASFALRQYGEVFELSERLLSSNPGSWVAMTYKAIALFWLGADDFSHLSEILAILEKARMLSDDNELVFQALDSIANDLVLLAAKSETSGDELTIALAAFRIGQELSTLKDSTLEGMLAYCGKAAGKIMAELERQLQRDKKDYDPPARSVESLFQLGELTRDRKVREFFYLHGKHHLARNKGKSYASTLSQEIESVGHELSSEGSDVVGKALGFSLFGKPVIKAERS